MPISSANWTILALLHYCWASITQKPLALFCRSCLSAVSFSVCKFSQRVCSEYQGCGGIRGLGRIRRFREIRQFLSMRSLWCKRSQNCYYLYLAPTPSTARKYILSLKRVSSLKWTLIFLQSDLSDFRYKPLKFIYWRDEKLMQYLNYHLLTNVKVFTTWSNALW